MRKLSLIAALAATVAVSPAFAQAFSTSALNPGKVPANGVIAGGYPQGEATWYFVADLKAGELASQIAFMGRPGRDKSLEISLLDQAGKRVGGHNIMGSIDANEEQARVLPVDASGRYTLRVVARGPETTSFRIELGGSAFAGAPAAKAADVSHSYLAPAPVPADGVITGQFPAADDGVKTFYYYGAKLKAGRLLTQLSFAGRPVTTRMVDKWVDFTVLNDKGRPVGGYAIMSGLNANEEATKAIAIDNSGSYVLRIAVKGPEGTAFKLELGGDAIAAR
jgi:hypothetical protein